MTLLDQDWTEVQAQGLLDALHLVGGTPNWKPEHLRRLRDWCSANGKDPATVDGQLEFVAYELCNSFQAVGRVLKQAKTIEEAREIVRPYVRRLNTSERPDIATYLRAESSPTSIVETGDGPRRPPPGAVAILPSAQDSEGRQPSPGIRSFPSNSFLGSEITERRGAAVTAASASTATTIFDEPFDKLLRRLLPTPTPGPQRRRD
jgi:Phage tail lysozyme